MSNDFERLVTMAESDPGVLGVLLGGSRGKGLGTAASDWDVYVVVAGDEDVQRLRALAIWRSRELDLCGVYTLQQFEDHASIGDAYEWNRYNFAHLVPVFDRTPNANLGLLCEQKEWLPESVARERAALVLDAYVNSYYRSMKNARDGNLVASGLDAAESVTHLVALAFAAEQRVAPYNKFLSWELAVHPLRGDWWPGPEPTEGFLGVVRSGDLDLQAAHFVRVEEQARELGYGHVLDAWGAGSLRSLRSGRI